MGKGQREMYRQIHGRHLCPVAAINPSVGQDALALPLIGIWTKGATTGQTCSGQPGQGRELFASPEEAGLFTGLQSASLEDGGLCPGGAGSWVPCRL